jgi:hypothetical protein
MGSQTKVEDQGLRPEMRLQNQAWSNSFICIRGAFSMIALVVIEQVEERLFYANSRTS